MCLMVYIGTRRPLQADDSSVVGFDEVDASRTSVRQWFSLPCVRHIGIPSGNCSCAFRSVNAQEPIDWFDGMWADRTAEERRTDRAIAGALRDVVLREQEIELYAVWDGDEGEEPLWRVTRDLEWLNPERFFVQEDMFYRVRVSSAP